MGFCSCNTSDHFLDTLLKKDAPVVTAKFLNRTDLESAKLENSYTENFLIFCIT